MVEASYGEVQAGPLHQQVEEPVIKKLLCVSRNLPYVDSIHVQAAGSTACGALKWASYEA